MPTLTRRREDRQTEHWLVFADDILIGSIGVRAGVPVHVDQWQWTVAVYPASHRGLRDGGTAATFAEAREAFERSWRKIEPQITETDRAEQHRECAHTAWKYRMWKAGCRLPTQMAGGRSRCFCGAEIDLGSVNCHIDTEHSA